MKTTLDLPDDLLIEAKAVAARRRTTLKDLITRSLRREIGSQNSFSQEPDSPYELSELGLPTLKKRGARINTALIHDLLETADREATQDVLKRRTSKKG